VGGGKLIDGQLPNEIPDHHILREYDADGKLLRTALPVRSFSDRRSHPCADCFMSSNAKRIGVYSRSANEYIEFDSSGNQTGRWRTSALSSGVSITGTALTDSGDFYIGGGITQSGGFQVAVFRLEKQSGVAAVDVENRSSPVSAPRIRRLSLRRWRIGSARHGALRTGGNFPAADLNKRK
jgi:hypothetical protein